MTRSSHKLRQPKLHQSAPSAWRNPVPETPSPSTTAIPSPSNSSSSTAFSSPSESSTDVSVDRFSDHVPFSRRESPPDEGDVRSAGPIPLYFRGSSYRSTSSWLSFNSSLLSDNNATPPVPRPAPRRTSRLQELNTPKLRRLMHGDFPLKLHLTLVGLKSYGWLQKKAGWDEHEPPVQVYRDSKFVAPEDWPEDLKRRYGYSAKR